MKTARMALSISSTSFLVLCSTTYVIGTIAGFGAVNSTSVTLIPIVRALALSAATGSLILHFLHGKGHKSAIFGISAFLFLFLYGIFRGLPLVGNMYSLQQYVVSATVIAVGIVVFSLSQGPELQKKFANWLIVFFWAWVLMLIVSGGLSLNFPQQYNFEITRDGNLLRSSQGLTKFFAIASLLALYLGLQSRTPHRRMFYYGSVIAFAFLSFLAGSRGEFLALIVCISLLYASGNFNRKLLAVASLSVIYLIFIWGMQNLADEMAAFARYKLLFLDSDLSMRDTLFLQSVALIMDNPKCLFLGCGFAYFQTYYGYDYGLYPHNSILEAIITWGLPAFLALFASIILGARHVRWNLPLSQVGLLSLLISLKSGDLMGGWLAMSFAFYLSGTGLSRMIKRGSLQGTTKKTL